MMFFHSSCNSKLAEAVPVLANAANLRAQFQWLVEGDIEVRLREKKFISYGF